MARQLDQVRGLREDCKLGLTDYENTTARGESDAGVFSTTVQPPHSLLKIRRFVQSSGLPSGAELRAAVKVQQVWKGKKGRVTWSLAKVAQEVLDRISATKIQVWDRHNPYLLPCLTVR
jgi:hypothetical protein